MRSVDFKDLDQIPDVVTEVTAMLVENTVHLAKLLKEKPYKGYK